MTAPGTSFSYTYDAVGNRATQTVGANGYTLNYGSTNNRLASTTGPIAPRTFTYDFNGSITGTVDEATTFRYDTRGRMNKAISVAGTTNYTVNSLGQRIRKTNLDLQVNT